jgi:hypothetical protein
MRISARIAVRWSAILFASFALLSTARYAADPSVQPTRLTRWLTLLPLAQPPRHMFESK